MAGGKRSALVTGANRGLGLATCRVLAERGLGVVLSARRGEDAEAAARELGGGVRAEELDLSSEDSVRACAARLRIAGIAIDVLVNNGGVLFEGDALATAPEAFRAAV
jgi:NAD(P)-dependent dehydrogenase (short-subunit alcohol dehydrogenase family)